jgi:hypothetical protein
VSWIVSTLASREGRAQRRPSSTVGVLAERQARHDIVDPALGVVVDPNAGHGSAGRSTIVATSHQPSLSIL